MQKISELLPGLLPASATIPEPMERDFALTPPTSTPVRRRKSRSVSGLTPTQLRLMKSPAVLSEAPDSVLYQHSSLCQTCLPYRNPGDEVREWERVNGNARIRLEAGPATHPETGRFVRIGLPYGPKPRIILAHLNAEALRTGSPEIEVEASLTAFISRMGLDTNGRNMKAVKDQLARLSTTTIYIGRLEDGEATTDTAKFVGGFRVWFPRSDQRRILWPSTVRLSLEYFTSLQNHAVPLNEAAVAALSHSAMALDVYSWLAQRLHRIPSNKPAVVPWAALQAQFGWHYDRIRDFRQAFLVSLKQVHTQYRAARLEVISKGMRLHQSPPPVPSRIMLLGSGS
jgi:hypothetical protein